MSGQSPPIKNTQLDMLRTLLSKRGWTPKDFSREAQKELTNLTQAEARVWITRLTNETRNSVQQRPRRPRSANGYQQRPEHTDSRPQQRHTSDIRREAPPVVGATAEEIATACASICEQLDLNQTKSEAIINKTLQEVGIKTGLLALAQTVARRQGSDALTIDHHQSLWSLTPLEMWVNLAKAFHNV